MYERLIAMIVLTYTNSINNTSHNHYHKSTTKTKQYVVMRLYPIILIPTHLTLQTFCTTPPHRYTRIHETLSSRYTHTVHTNRPTDTPNSARVPNTINLLSSLLSLPALATYARSLKKTI